MKEFRAIFRFHQFWSSCEKKNISQYWLYFKMYGIYINLGCRFEFRTQKLPYERILGNFFRFHWFWSSGPGMQKKGHFPILAVFRNIWDLHKFGLQIWIPNAKLPYERISGNFFDFIDFGHQVRVCKKRSFPSISCISKYMGTYINLGCRFEFRTQKLPYERISGNFFDFIDFGHQVRYAKKDHFSILAVIQNIWDLHKFGLQIWI